MAGPSAAPDGPISRAVPRAGLASASVGWVVSHRSPDTAAGATWFAWPTRTADRAPSARYHTGIAGSAQLTQPALAPGSACTAQPPPTRMNWYPALSAGSPPIVSERPAAGRYQAGWVPATGRRTLSLQAKPPTMIPSRSTDGPGWPGWTRPSDTTI